MPDFTTNLKNNIVTVSARIDGQEMRKVKIEIGKEYICLPFNKNILRLVVQTKALVSTTIFYIVEVKNRSGSLWDL